MERSLGSMTVDQFRFILKQLQPHSEQLWKEWEAYVNNEALKEVKAGLEDYFYFQICAKSLILHGFGEPILDKTILDKVRIATEMRFPTYFSMNPVNIFIDKVEMLMEAGLGYLKFSLEGMDNASQLKYRGKVDIDFETTLNKIHTILELKEKKGHKTVIILTKLNFKENDPMAEQFLDYWKQYPVLAYVKNQHNRWLYEEDGAGFNSAEYMQRYCEFPWSSASILYDGTVVPCPLDYEGHLNMGNVFENTLEEIWNSTKYEEFRQMHIDGTFPKNHFCKSQCDFKQVYEFRGLTESKA
jgi:radical SAM protein with 4Fe4S-binding SPASM domain